MSESRVSCFGVVLNTTIFFGFDKTPIDFVRSFEDVVLIPCGCLDQYLAFAYRQAVSVFGPSCNC